MLTVFASEATSFVELHSHRSAPAALSPQNSYQCTLTPTQDCMPGLSFFRQISMSHQLLPTHKPLQKHYPLLTACNICCPLSTYMFYMVEGKYEADIVPMIKALVGKKKSNPMPCYCFDMNCILMGKNCQFFSDI